MKRPLHLLAKLLQIVTLAAASLAVSLPASAAGSAVGSDMEARVAACVACHGRVGSATGGAYFPRLAGKPAGYLYEQLLSFRDGRRYNSDMTHMVQNLSNDYLREMADYFAAIDLPYPAVSTQSDASAQTLAHGKTLALQGDPGRGIPACASCHGAALTGVLPGIPPLVGLPRLYLASQLGDWLTDSRHAPAPDCMADVGRKLNTADINAVASWLAIQPVTNNARPVAALPAPLPHPCSAMPQ